MAWVNLPSSWKLDGKPLELGSAQTRSWRTASSGFAELWHALQSSRANTQT